MTLKRFETFVIVLIIAGIGVIYALKQTPAMVHKPAPSTQQAAQSLQQSQPNQEGEIQQVAVSTLKYKGEEGKTALEILKSTHQVQTKAFTGIGEFVQSIDGLEADSKTTFWSFYVNGRQSPVGAGEYKTHEADEIEWKIETIDQ